LQAIATDAEPLPRPRAQQHEAIACGELAVLVDRGETAMRREASGHSAHALSTLTPNRSLRRRESTPRVLSPRIEAGILPRLRGEVAERLKAQVC
jgi:hypothetical protein